MLRVAVNALILLLLISVAGCAAGNNYGTTSRNGSVDRIFRSGPMPTDYRYYYYGWEEEPTAILGIRNEYALQANFWHEVDVTEQQLKSWRTFFIQSIGWYEDRQRGALRFNGYTLNDLQGNEVGILYSRYDWTVLKFPGKNVVVVYPPEPRPTGFSLFMPGIR